MGRGYTFYQCQCGGEIFEEWDAYGNTIKCGKCENPKYLEDKIEKEKEKEVDLPF